MTNRVLICAYACLANPGVKVPGGGDIMAWNLVKRLGRTRSLWVLTAAQNRNAIEAEVRREPLPKVEFYYVDLPGWVKPLLRHQGTLQLYAYLWQWRTYFVARRLHKQVRFDAFHHLTYENDWMASIIGALLPVPYLRGPGGGAHRVPRKFRRQFPTRSYLWEYVRIGFQWILRHDPFFVMGHERARVLLMANREALSALPQRWRHKAELLSVNGVSSTDLALAPTISTKHDKYRVLTGGRLVPIKGFDLAIRAFKVFLEGNKATSGPRNAELIIVGEGPERPRLEALANDVGLNGHACFLGWMARERVIQEMAASDVFLFPSLRDGGGLVVVEAMAAGKPVVCLDLGGPGLHITEECGIKVSPQSPEQSVADLAAALERLYISPELRLAMGRAARQRAQDVYDWDRVADRIERIYSAISRPRVRFSPDGGNT